MNLIQLQILSKVLMLINGLINTCRSQMIKTIARKQNITGGGTEQASDVLCTF